MLDLACGADRHSILFAKNNFVVSGIDISENLLCTARKTAEELGLQNKKIISLAYNCLLDNDYFILDFFNIVYLKDNLILVYYNLISDGLIKQERTVQRNRIIKKSRIIEKIFYRFKKSLLQRRIGKYDYS